MTRRWSSLLRSLGESVAGVARAEAAALGADLKETGRRLAVSLGLTAIACFLAFWAVGALAFMVYQMLNLWLSDWAATLVVLAIFTILTLVFALLARRRWAAIEVPTQTVRRRFDDHVAWWHGELLQGDDWLGTDRLIEDDTDGDD